MKLMNKTNKSLTAIVGGAPVLPAYADEIKALYGNVEQMCNYWHPIYMKQRAENYATSFTRLTHTYGEDAMAFVLRLHLNSCMVRMGETKFDHDTATSVSAAMVNIKDDEVRCLEFRRVLGFFTAIENGEYDLYSCTHLHIMRAFNQYCKKAYAEQVAERAERERMEKDEAHRKHAAESITFEEYQRRTGYTGENPLTHLNAL